MEVKCLHNNTLYVKGETEGEVLGKLGMFMPKNTEHLIISGISHIDSDAFRGCTNLKSVEIRDGLKTIGDWAFSGCASLSYLSIPRTLTSIGSWAFQGCGFTKVKLWQGIYLGTGVFHFCKKLKKVEISAETVPSLLFKDCKNLEHVGLNGVKTIEDWAFSGCTALASVTIPDSVTTVGNGAFERCKNLERASMNPRKTKMHRMSFWESPVIIAFRV